MPTVLRALLLAVVFTALPVSVGVAMTGGEQADPPPSYVATPLRDFDTTTVAITRGSFCGRVPGAAVTDALGAPATAADGYGNGDRRALGDGTRDVVHEYGCTYAAGHSTAKAWVFAPPVTRQRAQQLAATGAKGCKRPSAPRFGSPSAATVCGGKTRTATYRGLFGDAWLTCSLALPRAAMDDAALLDRTGKWCVAVAEAASRS